MRLLITIINFCLVCLTITFLFMLSAGIVLAIIGINITILQTLILFILIGIALFCSNRMLLKQGYVTEKYLEYNNHLKPLSELDRKRVFHIFDDVCNKSGIKRPNIYIDETLQINATVVGTDLLILNRGLLNFATRDELHAIIAHELGHIKHKDNIFEQYNFILKEITDTLFQMVSELFNETSDKAEHAPLLITLLTLPFFIYAGILYVLKFLVEILVNIVGRLTSPAIEYRADRYAIDAGLGEHLISFGEKMLEICPDERKNYRFYATHPTWKKRVEVAQKLQKEVV